MTKEEIRQEAQELYNEYRKSDFKTFTDFLIYKIAELKEKLNFSTQYYQGEKAKEQLTKAKEILEELAKMEYAINPPADKVKSLMVKAEQFLNSELQSKWINPARTTNDNKIKLNSEVEK